MENTTPGMTDKQKAEFMKHLPQICEAKALNGAIRTALHIKGTYLLEEIKKPFVVAYLVPNLNHDEVKKAAIESMFLSSQRLFGNVPSVAQKFLIMLRRRQRMVKTMTALLMVRTKRTRLKSRKQFKTRKYGQKIFIVTSVDGILKNASGIIA